MLRQVFSAVLEEAGNNVESVLSTSLGYKQELCQPLFALSQIDLPPCAMLKFSYYHNHLEKPKLMVVHFIGFKLCSASGSVCFMRYNLHLPSAC